MASELGIIVFLILCLLVGALVTVLYFRQVLAYDREAAKSAPGEESELKAEIIGEGDRQKNADGVFDLIEIISSGAHDFLYAEYRIMAIFILVFAIIVFVFTGAKGASSFKPKDVHIQYSSDFTFGAFSALAFIVGALTSILAGYIGMYIATVTNGRVTMKCYTTGIGAGFSMAIKGGMVMGFGLVTLGLANLLILLGLFSLSYTKCDYYNDCELNTMYDALAAYGLGASSIAMFGRVGGGIYTKAADVGADLFGKIEKGFAEDDRRNPATIADNVGDNVGDVAGMGSDLFGSFAEGTCAAMVILASASNCVYWDNGMQAVANNFAAMCFPMSITGAGIVACYITSLFATSCSGVSEGEDGEDNGSVEYALKVQLFVSTVLMTPTVFMLAGVLLPDSFWVAAQIGHYHTDLSSRTAHKAVCEAYVWDTNKGHAEPWGTMSHLTTEAIMNGQPWQANADVCLGAPGTTALHVKWWHAGLCVAGGLWAGLVIGFITERYTSNTYQPVKDVAHQCQTGAATNIISGLALGYNSVVIPVITLAMAIYTGFAMGHMFGVACAALGMMCTLCTCLTIDGFGPISDNAGGIAEMVPGIPPNVRDNRTDILDAAGNTTAAIGKGFAIGSAAMVALALFGGYCSRADIQVADVSVLEPMTFFGLLIGSMLPYWFSAFTMKSVSMAAHKMVEACQEQFEKRGSEVEQLKNDPELPPPSDWYQNCIRVATDASLKEMVAPSALVMLSPLIVGIFFGKLTLAGLLIGAIVSGVQMALSASNSGGAWDNAKKYIEQGAYAKDLEEYNKKYPDDQRPTDEQLVKNMQKGTPAHEASIVGDTVGDPLKDTSGPAINILMKLMAIIALVFAPFVASTRNGYGLLGCTMSRSCGA